MNENCKNIVLIEVSGGVAEISHAHEHIDVYVIDWDVMENNICPWCFEDFTEDIPDNAIFPEKCKHCEFPLRGDNVLEFIMKKKDVFEDDQPR